MKGEPEKEEPREDTAKAAEIKQCQESRRVLNKDGSNHKECLRG